MSPRGRKWHLVSAGSETRHRAGAMNRIHREGIMKKGMFRICLLAGMLMSVVLSGCIISTSPGTEDGVLMQPGETKVFKVNGVNLNSSVTQCNWFIDRMDGNPEEVIERTDQIKFTANPEGEKYNRVVIECVFYRLMLVPPIGGGGGGWVFIETSRKTWNVCVARNTAPVWQGDFYMSNSADMQALDGYTEITGSVYVMETNLKNLEGLNAPSRVDGSLVIIGNTALKSLTGFEGLASIGEDLKISSNASLKSLSGLENLSSVGRYARIEWNDSLENISGLNGLTIGDTLWIEVNNALKNLSGMKNVTASDLYIMSNNALTSLSGLENITARYMWIYDNQSMKNLSGAANIKTRQLDIDNNYNLASLSGIENIEFFSLSIWKNRSLTSLSGLEYLTSKPVDITIKDNMALTDLSGLRNLTFAWCLEISGNSSLTALGMDSLQRVDCLFEITDNPKLCTSLAEVFRDQLLARGGIGGGEGCYVSPFIVIESNKDCTTP